MASTMSLILFVIILAITVQIPNAVRWHQRNTGTEDTGPVAGAMIVLVAVLAFAAANM